MILQENNIHRKVSVAILINEKINFKIRRVTWNKGENFTIIIGTLHQQDITFINIYAPEQGSPKHIKTLLTELKEETDKSTIILGT